jgi:transcription-repair coupling factor (superfamily II helicase)
MATLDTLAEIDEMAAELADRFGPIPDPLHNLLYQLRIKALGQMAGVNAVVTEAGQIRIRIAELGGLDRYHLQRYLGEGVRVRDTYEVTAVVYYATPETERVNVHTITRTLDRTTPGEQ